MSGAPSRERPLVLFLHGLGAHARSFAPLIAALEDLAPGFELAAFDFAGFGGTAAPPGGVSMRAFAEQVRAEAARRDPARARPLHLVAHSMGGAVALEARRLFPELEVASFLNLEGNLLPEDCAFSGKIAARSLAEFRAEGFPALRREIGVLAARGDAGAADWLAGLARTTPEAVHAASADLVRVSAEVYPVYRDWGVRSLDVFGELSLPAAAVTRARLERDGKAVAVVRGAGHALMVDRPAETAALCRALWRAEP